MTFDGEVEVVHPVTKVAATIPVSIEVLEDSRYIATAVGDAFDRWQHPWKYPDRIAWPEVVLFPRLAAARERVRQCRRRLTWAWYFLRHDPPRVEPDDEDDDW